jgi:hypothetical protein
MHLHPPERTHLYKVRFGVQVNRVIEIERGKGSNYLLHRQIFEEKSKPKTAF